MPQIHPENKWYNNKVLLIPLFFIFPPLRVYAMAKHKNRNLKKVFYILSDRKRNRTQRIYERTNNN
jgi:hypothetical protein